MKHRVNSINKVGLVNSDGHVIGLDIGATAVRAAALAPEVQDGRPSVSVHSLGSVPLPAGAVTDGAVAQPGVVTAAIKQLWRSNKLGDRKVVLGIASQQVVVRDLAMPDLPLQEFRAALPFQAREIIAIPVEQALLDFCPVGPADPATSMVPGLLIAAPRKPVLETVSAVEKAGLQVARVDLAPLASMRSIAADPDGVEMVVDIGAQLTSVTIHRGGTPKVVRVVGYGSETITGQLVDRLALSTDDAEAAKRTIGLDSTEEISRTILDVLRPLFSEIRGSVHFYSSGAADAPLQTIGLTGGGAGVPGLADALSDQFGVPARVVTPMQHLRNRFRLVPEAVDPDVSDAPGDPAAPGAPGAPGALGALGAPGATDVSGTSAVAIGLAMGAAA